MSGSFEDIDRQLAPLTADRVRVLTHLAGARGRQGAFQLQNPEQLETLRQIALIQSTEASNAIENITAPRTRIEALVRESTAPKNRSEQEIAGYRFVLDQVHEHRSAIPFEPRYVEQLHGYLYRYTSDSSAGHWKRMDNAVVEVRPDGTSVERFKPVPADKVSESMQRLHDAFNTELALEGHEAPLLIAAYILDFLVIHPFKDGNGRMARVLTLWTLYLTGFEVGRYVSLEKLIDETRTSYYEALAKSTTGWHEAKHDLVPWTDYFLGILVAAYAQFEERAQFFGASGAKTELVKATIRSLLTDEFTTAELRAATPGVSDGLLRKVLEDLKRRRIVESLGRGRYARWKRLERDFD